MRYEKKVHILLWLLLCVSVGPVRAELSPQQIAVVVNRSSLESVQVGEHYASRRGIPATQIIRLDLGPLKDAISRQEYEQLLMQPLRQALTERGLATTIRVLLPVYGVPLSVQAPKPTDAEQRWGDDAQARHTRAVQALETLATQVDPTGEPTTKERETKATSPEQTGNLLTRIETGLRQRLTRLQGEKDRQKAGPELQELRSTLLRVGGVAALVRNVPPASAGGSPLPQAELQQLQAQVAIAWRMLQALLEAPTESNRPQAYQLAERVFGLQGVLRLATTEAERRHYSEGSASVDSELSLLWVDAVVYGLAKRIDNPVYHAAPAPSERPDTALPILLVSRLDAPTPQLAKQLVDHAIQAEQHGLQGTVYVDARWKPLPAAPLLSTAFYDQSLRTTAELFRSLGTYPVVFDETERTFQTPGEAPDVAAYVGWYRYRAYEDAFTFRPGSLGYHIASGEAVSVHDPKERGWCKNALERGITVTLGPISEPYLDAFPLPAEFFGLLLTGRYALVEVYYLTTRYLSWRMVLFGDPLYNPWRGKGLLQPAQLTLLPASGRAAEAFPTAPTARAFPDPLQWRARHEQERQELLTQVERMMQVLERRNRPEPLPRLQ